MEFLFVFLVVTSSYLNFWDYAGRPINVVKSEPIKHLTWVSNVGPIDPLIPDGGE